MKYKPKLMTKGQFESLGNVLDYFEAEFLVEEKHWNETGQPKKHVHNDKQRLRDFMAQCQVKETKDADN